jgi:hypothetical protein
MLAVEGDAGERRAGLALARRWRSSSRRGAGSSSPSSKSTVRENRADSRRSATLRMRSSERPGDADLRPVPRDSPEVCSRAALEAKVVTTTPGPSPRRHLVEPARTVASEPDGSPVKTLVESQTMARTPWSPIARSPSSRIGLPICG